MNTLTIDEKRQIATALQEAINREELLKKEAAWYLNVHPNYITWVFNEKYWDSISDKWNRLMEWYQSREKISEFKLPEGEYYIIEKPVRSAVEGGSAADKISPAPEHSPETILAPASEPVIPMNCTREPKKGKSKVKKMLDRVEDTDHSSEIRELRQKMKFLEDNVDTIQDLKKQQEVIIKNTTFLADLMGKIAVLFNKPVEEKPARQVVIFQRNIYHK